MLWPLYCLTLVHGQVYLWGASVWVLSGWVLGCCTHSHHDSAADLSSFGSPFRIPEAAMSKHGSFKYRFESEVNQHMHWLSPRPAIMVMVCKLDCLCHSQLALYLTCHIGTSRPWDLDHKLVCMACSTEHCNGQWGSCMSVSLCSMCRNVIYWSLISHD